MKSFYGLLWSSSTDKNIENLQDVTNLITGGWQHGFFHRGGAIFYFFYGYLKSLIFQKQFHCCTHQLEKACNEWPVGSSRPLLESLFDFEIIHLCKYENCD